MGGVDIEETLVCSHNAGWVALYRKLQGSSEVHGYFVESSAGDISLPDLVLDRGCQSVLLFPFERESIGVCIVRSVAVEVSVSPYFEPVGKAVGITVLGFGQVVCDCGFVRIKRDGEGDPRRSVSIDLSLPANRPVSESVTIFAEDGA